MSRPAPARPDRPARRAGREDLRAEVVVIGAGIAGLTAAALLAKAGHDVVVIERDLHPGGCAASYARRTVAGEFRFAAGATLAAGLEPGGVLRQVYDRLGLVPRYQALDPAIRVHLPDRRVEVAGSRQGWASELERAFPGGLPGKRRFWRELQGLADAMHHVARRFPVMPFRGLPDLLDTARGAHPGAFRLLFTLHRTVADLLERHGVNDPAHRAFLDGQLLDSMQVGAGGCALPNGAYALEVYRYGAQYVPGGLSTIAEDLAAAVEANGGRIHYATRARRLLVSGGRVEGVEAHRVFRAPVVISTAPLPDTVELLGQAAPDDLVRAAGRLPEMWSAFTLSLAVHRSAFGPDHRLFEQLTLHDPAGRLEFNALVSSSPAWDRRRAPEGYHAVTVSTHVRPEGWFGLERSDYAARKAAHARELLGRLEAIWPRLPGAIVHLEAGTPRSFQGFTLHSLGRVGGFPQTPAAANFHAPHHASGLTGLFLAGETIFPGQGSLGVAVSGFNAQRAARRLLARRALTARPFTGSVAGPPPAPARTPSALAERRRTP